MSYNIIDIVVEANGTLSATHSIDNKKGEPVELTDDERKIKVSDEKIIEVLINILKENRLRGGEEYEMLGALLYNALLDNSIGRELFELKNDDVVEKIKVELRFNGAKNNFAYWPWEYLFCPNGKHGDHTGYFLSTDPKIIMSRPVNAKMEELNEPLRVLLVAAGPSSSADEAELKKRKAIFRLPLLAYEKLFEVISVILRKNPTIHVHELVTKKNKAPDTGEEVQVLTLKDFENSVNQIKPHIIHFLGHGRINNDSKEGEIAFTKEDGRLNWVAETAFANIIKAGKPKFVFLQACETAALAPYKAISGVARQLTGKDGLAAVVAMQCKINQDSAFDFSESFYKKLSTTGIIDDAMQEGRQSIVNARRQLMDSEEAEKDFAFGIPVLYVKDRKPLFIIPGEPHKEISDKNKPTGMGGLHIYCYVCGDENIAIDARFCPNGCGEFVDRPVPNCTDKGCPQKILKKHSNCARCGAVNTHFQKP